MQILASIAVLVLAIPAGLLLASLTKDEKPIYKKYFTPLLWIIAMITAIFYTLNLQIALTLTFIFILILTWRLKK